MKRIKIKALDHRNEKVYGLFFEYDKICVGIIKELPGAHWSFSKKCWVLKRSIHKFPALIKHFEGYAELVPEGELQGKVDLNVRLTPFRHWLEQKRYGARTIQVYVDLIKVFLRHYQFKKEEEITVADVEAFNRDYILAKGYSVSYQRQMIGALKLYFGRLVKSKLNIHELERPKKEFRLPVVLSKEEVMRILVNISNPKQRLLIALLYGSGLRIGELINLRLSDIDGDRLQIRVRQAKGKMDRYVTLSARLLDMLRVYWRQYKPKDYIFEGAGGEEYSRTSVRMILNRACERAGILKSVTPHTLRHSYATHLLEAGIDLRYVQELLGHRRPETTMIYTHVTQKKLDTIRSPFDRLFDDLPKTATGYPQSDPFLIP